MGAFGDLLFDLTGQVDPRRKMAQALAGANQPPTNAVNLAGSVNPVNAAAGGTPGGHIRVDDPTGASPPPQQQQQAQAPPQPQAYTSAPDFSKMYLDLLNRQESSDAIDRGMGLLFAGFAQPQDRAGMVNAMSAGTRADPASMITEMQTAQLNQGKIEARAQLLANAPVIAKQLNMPVEQVIAAINSGAMDDIIKEHDKATTLQASPLYKAQTASAQGEADLHAAQIDEQRALANLHNAEIEGVPAKIEQAKAEAEAARQRAAEAAANASKVPSEVEKNKAETDAARARAENEPLTPEIKNYKFYIDQFNKDPANQGKTPLAFNDWRIKYGGSSTPKSALTVTWRQKTGDDGKPVLDENGNPIMEGVQLSDVPGQDPTIVKGAVLKAQRTDTGTGWVYVNPYTGQPIGAPISKNVQETAKERATGTEEGKTQAEARTGLEGKLGAIDDNIKIIEDAINDPNLPNRVGSIITNPKRLIPPITEEDINTQSRIDQAMKLNMAQIAAQLHAAGISRVAVAEVMNAAGSVNRLQYTNMSPADYRKAGQEAIDRLQRAMAIAYDEAGVARPDHLKNINLETGAAPPTSSQPTVKPPAAKVWKRNKDGKLELQ